MAASLFSRIGSNVKNLLKGDLKGIVTSEKKYAKELTLKDIGRDQLQIAGLQATAAGTILAAPVAAPVIGKAAASAVSSPQAFLAATKATGTALTIAAGTYGIGRIFAKSEKLSVSNSVTKGVEASNKLLDGAAELIDKPSLAGALDFATENKGALTILGAGALMFAGTKILPGYLAYKGIGATKDNTKAMQEAADDIRKKEKNQDELLSAAIKALEKKNEFVTQPPQTIIIQQSPLSEASLSPKPLEPLSPETTSAAVSTTVKRKKKKKKTTKKKKKATPKRKKAPKKSKKYIKKKKSKRKRKK